MQRYVSGRDVKSDDDEYVSNDRCCLRIVHVFAASLLLLTVAVVLLVASLWIEDLAAVQTPLFGLLGLASVIALATGVTKLSVEARLRASSGLD